MKLLLDLIVFIHRNGNFSSNYAKEFLLFNSKIIEIIKSKSIKMSHNTHCLTIPTSTLYAHFYYRYNGCCARNLALCFNVRWCPVFAMPISKEC